MSAYPCRTVLPFLCLFALITPLSAAEFCVTNSAELQNALTIAATNGEADTIRIATGNYWSPTGGFKYEHANLSANDHLTLIGGWSMFLGNPCGQILVEDPLLTTLNGGGTNAVMYIGIREGISVTVRLLGFFNGYVPGVGQAAGLDVTTPSDLLAGTITIERNAFFGNQGFNTGGLWASVRLDGSAKLRVINNIFVANHGEGAGSAIVDAKGGDGGAFGAGSFFTNNTVISNTTDAETGGVLVTGTAPRHVVANNNLWGNQGYDLRVNTNSDVRLLNNNIGTSWINAPITSANNISVEPEYEPCLLCFHWVPVLDSPLVDAGTHPGLLSGWYLTDRDLKGAPRVSGGRIDIGAFENHWRLFSDRFEQ